MEPLDLRHRRFLQIAAREHVHAFNRLSAARMLKVMDDTAGKAANIYVGNICMTRVIHHIDFTHAIRAGDAIDVETWIVRTGNTSLDVEVTVRGRDHLTHEIYDATSGLFTMVNVKRSFTGEYKAAPVPKLPATEDSLELEKRENAIERLNVRHSRESGNPLQKGGDPSLRWDDTKSGTPTQSAIRNPQSAIPYEPYFGQEHRNHVGSVHGGHILAELDQVAHHYAMWVTKHERFVTAAVDSIEFQQPILPSMLVTMIPQVLELGKTSICIGIQIYIQSHDKPEKTLSHHGKLWLVALDENEVPMTVSISEPTQK